MFRTSALFKAFRTMHLYLGVFLTPALLFFAFTGALQTLGLHETNRDHPSYKPAHWIVVLSQLHKKQVTTVPVRRLPAGGASLSVRSEAGNDTRRQTAAADRAAVAAGTAAPQSQGQARAANPLPLRLFFLLVCVGLVLSTLTGLTMSYTYLRSRILITSLLIAGVVVPVLLIFL